MRHMFRRTLGIGAAVVIAGCAATPPTPSEDRLAIVPSDFTVDMTILAPAVDVASTTTAPVQTRFVLFANGSLHFASDPSHVNSQDWLPPLSRMLTRQQFAQVWSLTNQLGFARDMRSGDVANFKLAAPAALGEVAYLAGFLADGHRWTIERRSPIDEPDPAMSELAKTLGQFAWAGEEQLGPVQMQPIRYDFGSDPYLQYRTVKEQP